MAASTQKLIETAVSRFQAEVPALANLKQLGASGISIDLPNISESLTAVRNYKVSREKAAR